MIAFIKASFLLHEFRQLINQEWAVKKTNSLREVGLFKLIKSIITSRIYFFYFILFFTALLIILSSHSLTLSVFHSLTLLISRSLSLSHALYLLLSKGSLWERGGTKERELYKYPKKFSTNPPFYNYPFISTRSKHYRFAPPPPQEKDLLSLYKFILEDSLDQWNVKAIQRVE